MAKVSLCVLPSRANQDGSMNIRVKITNINTTAYIATRFRIENMGQWKGERVVKHPEAEIMNRKLRKVIMEYEDPTPREGTSILHLLFSYCKFNTSPKIYAPEIRLEPFYRQRRSDYT